MWQNSIPAWNYIITYAENLWTCHFDAISAEESRLRHLCDFGRTQRQPFSTVASSNATHSPTHESGSEYRNVLSWCGTTSPPIPGCCSQTHKKSHV
jgi:hypothetical protein